MRIALGILGLAAIFLVAYFLIPTSLSFLPSTNYPQPAYVTHCRIFDESGNLFRKLMGWQCAFKSDGSYLSADDDSISGIDASGAHTWTQAIQIHHDQIRLHCDEKLAIVLAYNVHDYQGRKVVFDSIVAIDTRSGKILAQVDLYDHIHQLAGALGAELPSIEKLLPLRPVAPWNKYLEFGHGNGVNVADTCTGDIQLPTEVLYSTLNLFGVAQVLKVNLQNNKFTPYISLPGKFIHEAKVDTYNEDTIAVYVNDHPLADKRKISTLEFFDRKTGKPLGFLDHRLDGFQHDLGGGFDILDKGTYLLSLSTGKVAIYDRTNKRVLRQFKVEIPHSNGVYRHDLKNFFSNNKSIL